MTRVRRVPRLSDSCSVCLTVRGYYRVSTKRFLCKSCHDKVLARRVRYD